MTLTPLIRPLSIAAMALLFGACSNNRSSAGGARLSVGFHGTSESAQSVTSVTVTITGPGIAQPIFRALTQANGTGPWAIGVSNIPATPANQTDNFQVYAYDSSGATLFSGAANVPIIAGQDAVVSITAQAQTPTTSVSNSPPWINSLSSSAATLNSLQQVQFSASAYDPQGAPIRITWSATRGTPAVAVGSFSPAFLDVGQGQPFATTYTAPATDGDILVTATVAQTSSPAQPGGNLSTSESFTIRVVSTTSGNVQVVVTFNNSPYIDAVSFLPVRPGAGDVVNLHAHAADPDTGDVLKINWIVSGCPVTGFVGADPTGEVFNQKDVVYNVPAASYFATNTGGNPIQCSFTIMVNDYDSSGSARGGQGSTGITLTVGPTLLAGFAPVIDSFSQGATQDLVGSPVDLYVHAHSISPPPGINVITYSWGTNDGTIAQPDFANHAVWTPTANCVENPGAQAWVDVYDSTGRTTRQTFAMDTCLPKGCAGVLASHPEWTTPGTHSGVFQIDPDRTGPISPFNIWCDFSLPGGGWALVGNLGHSHSISVGDALLSRTAYAQNGNAISPGYDIAYGASAFEHYDLREFNAYGTDYTVLVETGDYTFADSYGNQLTWYRAKDAPACAADTCSPGIAGSNWLAGGRDTLFQVANYPSESPSVPLRWIDSPGFAFAAGAAPTIALLGYNVLAPAGCTATDCPCADASGTRICRHPAGGLWSGATGVASAGTSLQDFFLGLSDASVPVGGGGAGQNPAMIWIHEGRLDQFSRAPFPAAPPAGTPGPVLLSNPYQSLAKDYDGTAVALSIQATLPLPVAGKPNVISFAWTTNDGTIATQGVPGSVLWNIAPGCTPGSRATVTATPDGNAALASSHDFVLDTCPTRGCADVLKLHPEAAGTFGAWTIDPDGPTGPNPPFSVYCDLTDRLGGGWALVGWLGSEYVFNGTENMQSEATGNISDGINYLYWMGEHPDGRYTGEPQFDMFGIRGGFEHYDLTQFDPYGSAYTILVQVGDSYLGGANGSQLTFYRPKPTCTGAACKPSVAGGNWVGTGVDTLFQIANYASEYKVDPFSWIDSPGFDFTGAATPPTFGMFGYNVPAPAGCTPGNCPCANATVGTTVCYSPPGVMLAGNAGASTANSALDDLFVGATDGSHSIGAGGGTHNPAMIWIHDGALPANFDQLRRDFPATGNIGSGIQSAPPVVEQFSPAPASQTQTAAGQAFGLTVYAHAVEFQAGNVNTLRYRWSTSSGAVTPSTVGPNGQGSYAQASWAPDCTVTTPTAWVDVYDQNSGATVRQTFTLTAPNCQ